MDKYEYNLKLEEIDKLVDQGEYAEAAAMADTIEWKRVRNVRTLCLISEIYEAADRLEDSKKLLLRAYRRSPVGRTVLYRLVEVTTALKQYDEALEYYSEYIQAAPHDNTRYILKYMIYRGRGSAPEELIAILEEYLGQEYTEKWAYELAKLYQQTGQMQKCFATCDDLVLWFHSGKYVLRALELKSHFTSLTMKQQQIYEECLQEAAMESYDAPEQEAEEAQESAEAEETPAEETAEEVQVTPAPAADSIEGEILAENIIAETEREIAGQVTATKAEMEQEAVQTTAEEVPSSKESVALMAAVQNVVDRTIAAEAEQAKAEEAAEAVEEAAETAEDAVTEAAEVVETAEDTVTEAAEDAVTEAAEVVETAEDTVTEAVEEAEETAETVSVEDQEEAEEAEEKDFHIGLAKNMREILSGVVRHPEEEDDDIQNSVIDNRFHRVAKLQMPEPKQPSVAKLSIDDILLSMGDKGKKIAEDMKQREAEEQKAREEEEARIAEENKKREEAEAAMKAEQEAAEDAARQALEESLEGRGKSVTEAAEDELTEVQREALTYTNHPEKLLRNKLSLPTYSEKKEMEFPDEIPVPEEFAVEDKAMEEKAEAADILTEKTIRVPTEEISKARAQMPLEMPEPSEDTMEIPAPQTQESPETDELEALEAAEEAAQLEEAADLEVLDGVADAAEEPVAEEIAEAAEEEPAEAPVEEKKASGFRKLFGGFRGRGTAVKEEAPQPQEMSENEIEEELPEEEYVDEEYPETYNGEEVEMDEISAEDIPEAQVEEELSEEPEAVEEPEEEVDENRLYVPEHLRNLFRGFTSVRGLEDQIANAIIQAEAKGTDRTSRTGNILIFGEHGSGKTTLAVNLAKAIAQDKGNQIMKMAKIYATDLNRKDIAATVAKIAGGTLIIEEAGDLEDTTVDQLTTAMEFRTDGLIVILEDEQQYIHDLLMRHPRFTMKFTAQIYIPFYTAEELSVFGQNYAQDKDCVIGEDALIALQNKISAKAADGTAVSMTDVIAMVDKAVHKSGKFFRKVFGGKKRYDANDYVILLPKDFK